MLIINCLVCQLKILLMCSCLAANIVLLPFNYLVSSSSDSSRSALADSSLHVLLILIHYRKCVIKDEPITEGSDESRYFSDSPYCKALNSVRDIECETLFLMYFSFNIVCGVVVITNKSMLTVDRVDVEGNAHNGPLVRLSFASLYDTLGM